METRYYLYRHIRLDKHEPFYIGIGTKSKRNHPNIKSEYRRAYSNDRKESSLWNNIVSKTEYEVEILLESKEWQSATLAAKEINLHPTSIRHCVQGKTKTSGGFIWKAQNSYK